MAAKFYFFTDPALLGPQTADAAFGPVAPVAPPDGKDRFRVTDTHSATAAAPVFAICDGLICAQDDGPTRLTLILKPSERPPFDFPAISYILYKGVDRTSLLASDGRIDSSATGNDLITAITTAWNLPDNGNGTTTPSRNCLGLHLNQVDYPSTDNPQRFIGSEPLDRLFYDGDPAIQLPLVRGGWKLGNFIAGSDFGIEIVVERIGRRPKIELARQTETIVTADSLAAGANPSETFLHWDAKEAILDYIDPCAFWGSFFVTKLRVSTGANTGFAKLSGNAIYETVLRGTTVGAANFAHRNRAYLDFRNEHGNSLNYYQADGPNIQLTLDPAADIDASEVSYYGSGWPCLWVDNTNLPAGATGDRIDVRFALPKTANSRPLIYVATGYRDAFRSLKERKRFIDRQRRPNSSYLYEAAMAIPLTDDAGIKKIFAGYQKAYQFKRLVVAGGQPIPPTNPASFAPTRLSGFDCLLPLLTLDDLPLPNAPVILRTCDHLYYIEPGVAGSDGIVANAVIAADSLNVVLALVPRSNDMPSFSLRPASIKVAWPSLVLPEGENIFTYLARLLPGPLDMVNVADPEGSGDEMELLCDENARSVKQPLTQNNPAVFAIALSRTELSSLQAAVAGNSPAYGTPLVSLVNGTTHRDGFISFNGYGLRLDFLTGVQAVSRMYWNSSIKTYCHAT